MTAACALVSLSDGEADVGFVIVCHLATLAFLVHERPFQTMHGGCRYGYEGLRDVFSHLLGDAAFAEKMFGFGGTFLGIDRVVFRALRLTCTGIRSVPP
jgi:hypothetical protein